MRIGFYHETAGTLHASGIAVYVQQLAAELSASHEVYLYTQRGELADPIARSDVEVVETPPLYDRIPDAVDRLTPVGRENVAKAATAAWSWRRGVVDHVEEHVDLLFTFQFLDDLLISRLVDVPTVYGFHRLDEVGPGTRLRERFSRTEWHVANSEDTARRVASELGYEVDAVVTPGVDTDRFHPDVEPAPAVADPSADAPRSNGRAPFRVLFVGRFVPEKGIYDLLEAISLLEGEAGDRSVELHLVGRGDVAAVRAASRAFGIEERVRIHGEVPHAELPGYYAGADVSALPSRTESFGIANVEAMACGRPVVTSDLPAIRDYVDNGEHGLLVRPRDPRDVADKLSILASEPGRRAEMGRRACERARAFDWTDQADRLEAFCADVLGETTPRSPDAEAPASVRLP